MKLSSVRMSSRYKRRAFSVLYVFSAAALLAAVLLTLPPRASHSEAFPVLAAPALDDEDLVTLLSLNLGGHDVAVAAWSNMSLSEKQTLRDQAAKIVKMALAAEREGLHLSPGVERTLRWGAYSFLADAWEKKVSSETDLSDNAVRSFYEANRQRYAGSGAVRYRKAVYPASQKDVALRVKAQLKTAPLSRLKNCVTVGWTEYDKITPPLSEALRTSAAGVVMGPVQTKDGHVLYQVLERRKAEVLPLEQCSSRVKEDMIRTAVIQKLASGGYVPWS